MEKERLLGLRKVLKKKKPDFVKQDAHKLKRVPKKWKKPRGLQSKIRLHIRGYRKEVSKGYCSPKQVRGLHPTGLKPIWVATKNQLQDINKEEQGIIIKKTVGKKKKIELIKIANEKGIVILNVKNAETFVKTVEENLAKKKQEKQNKILEKSKKQKEAVKKPTKKETPAKEEKSEEEKKEQEKKEKDKILITKEA